MSLRARLFAYPALLLVGALAALRLFGGSAVAALVIAGLGYAVLLFLVDRHVRRIHELERTARGLASDGPVPRATETPADELGRLGRAINRLAEDRTARLAALARERDERERVLAHLNDGVAVIDGAGRLVRCNHSLATMLGVPFPPEPGAAFQSFARAPALDELLERVRANPQPAESEMRLWAGGPHLVHAAAIPLGDESPGATLLVLRDLSEIERLSRTRQEFVANVSHELRTPLTSLRGYAETLLEGGLEDVEHREHFVQVIRDNADRLGTLVEDLLSLAEIERPGARLRRDAFDLREMAVHQVRAFENAAAAAGLSLELVPGEAVPVLADRARLEQVLANLLQNAIKYTERGGVRVTVDMNQGWAWCEVEDTGPGIPEEDRARVFERFYRVEKARSREKGGTGLGLSIVKHIIALHGGEVSVESEPGRGSRFRFRIPRGA